MKRTLIALAVGAAFAAPAAYADVTLSGSINAGPAVVHSGDGSTNTTNSITSTGTTAQNGLTRTGINTNYSNITIGSMEDLGGGLKLDFAYQFTANFQATNSSPSNRNSHLGLVGDQWGGVWIGTNENLYERYYYTVDPLDGAAGIGGNLSLLGTPGYGQVFDAGNNVPSAGFYRRSDQSVWYDSPNWGGVTFGVYSTLSANKNANSIATGTTSQNPQIWGGGAKYVGPTIPIQVWAAYEHHHDMFGLDVIKSGGAVSQVSAVLPGNAINGFGTSSQDYGWQVGVGYTLGDIFVFGNFEQLKYKLSGLAGAAINEYKRNAYSIGAKWNIPTGYVGAQWMQALGASCDTVNGSNCDAGNTGAVSIGLGYYHTLSKQTQAYIMGQWINNQNLNMYTVAGGTGVPTNLGATIYAVTVGLKHSF
jgi:predicted porin